MASVAVTNDATSLSTTHQLPQWLKATQADTCSNTHGSAATIGMTTENCGVTKHVTMARTRDGPITDKNTRLDAPLAFLASPPAPWGHGGRS